MERQKSNGTAHCCLGVKVAAAPTHPWRREAEKETKRQQRGRRKPREVRGFVYREPIRYPETV